MEEMLRKTCIVSISNVALDATREMTLRINKPRDVGLRVWLYCNLHSELKSKLTTLG